MENNKHRGHKGQNPKDNMKNRLPVSEMKKPIEDFLKTQQELYISLRNETEFPDLEVGDYRYIDGNHILILTPVSIFLDKLESGSKFSGFIFDKEGRGLKMTKRVYGKFVCEELQTDNEILLKLVETDELIKKMLTHGAKFMKLLAEELTVFFGSAEIFTMNKEMNPSFAEYSPNGKKRYENSRHILMEYEGREVIFNTLVNGDTYQTLTNANSNKVSYIKNGGECKFYDGKARHFTSKVEILPDDKVDEIYNKLKDTNHSFFKTKENLIALEFYFK